MLCSWDAEEPGILMLKSPDMIRTSTQKAGNTCGRCPLLFTHLFAACSSIAFS